jgi:uncharacterized membrane protein
MILFKRGARWLFGLVFIAAGILHFIRPAMFAAIVPPYLPWPAALVAISGAAEILLGAMLLYERSARAAAWGLILLLLAVYPANVHMAINSHLFPSLSPTALWVRLPLQFVLIGIAFWFTRRGSRSPRLAAAP